MGIYRLQCLLLNIIVVCCITKQVTATLKVTFISEPERNDISRHNNVSYTTMNDLYKPYHSPRFRNLRKEVVKEKERIKKRIKRGIIIRCCGFQTCFPSEVRTLPSILSYRAYATFTWDGVSISCPKCPKGWESRLKWKGSSVGIIPIICKDCPNDWESMLDFESNHETTKKEEEEETDNTEETDEDESDKTTTVMTTTKATTTTKVATTITQATTKTSTVTNVSGSAAINTTTAATGGGLGGLLGLLG